MNGIVFGLLLIAYLKLEYVYVVAAVLLIFLREALLVAYRVYGKQPPPAHRTAVQKLSVTAETVVEGLTVHVISVIAEVTQVTMLEVAYSLHLLMVFIFIRLLLTLKEKSKPPELVEV